MTTETPRMPQVGDVVEGKYELLRRIGKGGMGVVFEARSLTLHRSVALKFLHPDMADNERLVERFQREARTAAAITHPCVTYVFDVGWTLDHVPYMAMELLDGHSLAAELRSSGVLAVPRVVHIGARVLDALEAAHRLGVVHRDLKPENIFLARQGTQENVKVLDFGISKLLGGDSGETLTKTGTVLGTPSYMPPEQVRCARDVDPRADLYALGAVLYELLCGRPPYQGETFTEIVYKIISEDPEPLAKLRPGLDPTLATVVERAMQKDPSRRWPTAEAMRSALEAAVDEPAPGEVKPTPLAWELAAAELPASPTELSSAATVATAPRPPEHATVAATPAKRSALAVPAVSRSSAGAPAASPLPQMPAATLPGTPQSAPSSRRGLLVGVPIVALVGALTAGVALWARNPAPTTPAPLLTAHPAISAVTPTLPPLTAPRPSPALPAIAPPALPPPVAAPTCRLRLVVTTPAATIHLGSSTYAGAVDLPAACGAHEPARVEAPGHVPTNVDLVATDGPTREVTLATRPRPRRTTLEANPF